MNISRRFLFNLALLNLVGKSLLQALVMIILLPFGKTFTEWNKKNIPSLITLVDEIIPLADNGERVVVLTKYKGTLQEILAKQND